MAKVTAVFPAMFVLISSSPAMSQDTNQSEPTFEECDALYDCRPEAAQTKAPGKQAVKRRPRQPAPATHEQAEQILTRLDEVGNVVRRLDRVPLPERGPQRNEPIVNVHNHYEMEAAARHEEERGPSDVRLALQAGAEADLRLERQEVAPGGNLSLLVKLQHLTLGGRMGYARLEFTDGSTVEDLVLEPVIGWEFLNGPARPYVSGSLGYWRGSEDWTSADSCGRSECFNGPSSSWTFSLEAGALIEATDEIGVFAGVPLRWVPETPEGSQWSVGVTTGISLSTP